MARTRTPAPAETADPAEPTLLHETDGSLEDAAKRVFEDMLLEPDEEGAEPTGEEPPDDDEYQGGENLGPLDRGDGDLIDHTRVVDIQTGAVKPVESRTRPGRSEHGPYESAPPISDETAQKVFGLPREEVFIRVRGGGQYLPARRRIVWMRGEPEQHPDWTIETWEISVTEGRLVNPNKVEGGYARMGARVRDESGRIIATGTKTEYSERFLDFVEKAETGAIARALAVAGYGTEAALDIDEGIEGDRIADAPVSPQGRPINISSSNVPGQRQGGRNENITDAQLNEIARLNKELGLGTNLAIAVAELTATQAPELDADPRVASSQMLAHLRSLTNEQAGQVIRGLRQAVEGNRDEGS